MNIGQAATASGVPAKTIRYYEEIGLIAAPARTASGYRDYDEAGVHTLRFVARARSLGFSIDECRNLLALWRDRGRASADVKRIALDHVAAIERKIAELEEMRATLVDLTDRCQGDNRPDCPILLGLEKG